MRWFRDHLWDVLLVVVGAVFVLLGLAVREADKPISGGVVTTGRIVDHVIEDEDHEPGTTAKYPVIEFIDRHERVYRFRSNVGGSIGAGEVGDVVKVRYDPIDPSRAQRADQSLGWIWMLASGGGIALWLVQAGLVVARRRGVRWAFLLTRGVDNRAGEQHESSDAADEKQLWPASARTTGGGTIFTEGILVVQQTSNTSRDVYSIETPEGRQLAVVASSDQRTASKLARYFNAETWFPVAAALRVADMAGNTLLTIERSFRRKLRFGVHGADGVPIVDVVQENHILSAARFGLHSGGRRVGCIVLDGDFILKDDDDTELARASDSGPRWGRLQFVTGVWVLNVSPLVAGPLRTVAVASLLSVLVNTLDADADSAWTTPH